MKRRNKPGMYFKTGNSWPAITWDLYGAAVRRIAGFLLAEGIEHAQRVAILSGNRPQWHIADLAIEHVGGTVVGIYLTSSAIQCQYILDHAEVPLVFVEDRAQLAKILGVRKDLVGVRRVVLISGDREPGDGDLVVTWAEALASGDTYNAEHAGEFERRWQAVGPDDVATFIYTSGTTGPPKAVMLTHHNILWTVASSEQVLELGPDAADEEVTVSYLPLAHIAERVAGLALHIQIGHRLYFAEDVARLGDAVVEARPTYMFGVPRIWQKYQAGVEGEIVSARGVKGLLARWALRQGYANVERATKGEAPGRSYRLADRLVLSKVRASLGLDRAKQVVSGAAPISEATLRFFWAVGLSLFEVYGLSESCGPCSAGRPGHLRIGTTGPPIPGVEIKIAADGEVLARGGNVFLGYYKDDPGTAEAVDDHGYLHTGDVGTLEDGYLRITDRKKDVIITAGGKNIAPSNIELGLKGQPYIGEAVAIGDGRPFMSALLTVDPTQAQSLAEEVGETADIEALTRSAKVREIFQAGVDAVNQSLSNAERIKKFVILPTDLSVAGGELTPTFKVKRKAVNQKYHDQIEEIYAG